MSSFELLQHNRHLCEQVTGVGGILSGWRQRLDPWVKKIHWRRKWRPTPVFLPGNSMERWAWRATVYGGAKSWTQLSTRVHISGCQPNRLLGHQLEAVTLARLTLGSVLTSHRGWMSACSTHGYLVVLPSLLLERSLPQGCMRYVYSSMEPASMSVVSPGWGQYCL